MFFPTVFYYHYFLRSAFSFFLYTPEKLTRRCCMHSENAFILAIGHSCCVHFICIVFLRWLVSVHLHPCPISCPFTSSVSHYFLYKYKD
jgi:hypothetical protein